MYEPIRNGHKVLLVFSSIISLLFAVAYSDNAFGSDFRSEDELIEETRANVERHLNGESQRSSHAVKIEKYAEAPKTVKELPVITEEPSRIPVKEETTPVVEVKHVSVETPSAAIQVPPPTIKKENVSYNVVTIDPETNSVTKSDKAAVGEDIKVVKGIREIVPEKPLVEPILKKMDVTKIGASPYYETYEGLRLLKYFTVAQRVEIYQEVRPIDSYILDANSMRILYGVPWNNKSDYRTQLTPLFTRAYGTEITMSDPKNKEGQIRYTHDYREIYRNYYPKWPQIQKEMWDQNEILFMHSKQIDPIGWNYASNLGYRYSTLSDKESPANVFQSYYNTRQTYFGSLSLAPNDKLEWFGQAEYYKSKYVKCSWAYSPDHFLGRTELRIKSNDMKTMYVPSFSFSKDYYYPFSNSYQKYEIQFRVGRDFTKRFSATSTVKYAMGLRDEPDNMAPTYMDANPYKDKAYTLALENRFSYNVYDRLFLQAGLDMSTGLNWSIFDNLGMLAGLEYYAPGMIRVDFGWTGNYYYNLQDFLSAVYFKFYLFM